MRAYEITVVDTNFKYADDTNKVIVGFELPADVTEIAAEAFLG